MRKLKLPSPSQGMLPRKIYARCGRVQVAVARLPFISTSSRSASCVNHPASSRPCPISRAFRAPPLTSLHRHHSCSYSTSSPTSISFPDPTRPDLFYHLIQPPNPLSSSVPAFALSFLATPPPFTDSSTIIGWLPASAPGKDMEAEAGLNDFRENPKFRDVLHEAIQTGLREGVDEVQINGAKQTQHGWMHIHDDRNIPALGRIGDPDDILATVLVKDGKILPETYQPMPSYRLCTADGLTQLTPGLAHKLSDILTRRLRTGS